MSRIARVVVPGLPYHVTQRGNGRQAVFFTDQDRRVYLDLLGRHAQRYSLRIWAYSLMSNHVHLVVVPQRQDALARTLARTHADYARYFNVRQGSCGHVWQARFFSCPLERQHLWRAMAYVERNPVRAGLVREAEEYRWSSAATHVFERDGDGLVDLAGWRAEYNGALWRAVLRTSVEEAAFRERLQEATLRGRVMGSEEFIHRLEQLVGRRLRPMAPGRPKRQHARPEISDADRQRTFGNTI